MEEGNPSNLSLFHLELRYMLCSVLASLFPDVKPSVPHLQCIYATNVMWLDKTKTRKMDFLILVCGILYSNLIFILVRGSEILIATKV